MNTRRRGFSLLETVAVIATASIAFSLAITAIVRCLGTERHFRSAFAEHLAIDQLARQLRSDIHAATTASLVPADEAAGAMALVLTLPADTRVRYEVHAPHVTRTTSVAGRPDEVRRMTLRRGLESAWTLSREDGRTFVEWTLRGNGPSAVPPVERRVWVVGTK